MWLAIAQPSSSSSFTRSLLELVNNRLYFLLLLTFNIALFLGCYKITTVFSHAQTVVLCVGCSTVLCQPTGGKARLTEGIHLAFSNPVLRFYYKYLPLLKASLKEILNSLVPREFYL